MEASNWPEEDASTAAAEQEQRSETPAPESEAVAGEADGESESVAGGEATTEAITSSGDDSVMEETETDESAVDATEAAGTAIAPASSPELIAPASSPELIAPESATVSNPAAAGEATGSDAPETGPQQTIQLFWQAWNQFQPVLKRQTIRLLRLTIQVLSRWLAALEGRPVSDLDSSIADPWLDGPSAGEAASGTDATTEPPSPLVQAWQWLLARIRDRIPDVLNQKLSDTTLTAGLASILVIVLAIGLTLLPGQPEAKEVATQPQPTPTPVSPFAPAPAPAAKPAPAAPPPKPTAPAAKPAPPPTLELEPEQDLIAAIQDQVAEVSNRYADGLIRSIQANFQSSRLIVQVSEGWYQLPRKKQERLANEMLRRSKDLDFSKLELIDPEGTLLARSPVVGDSMIILQREILTEPLPSEAAEAG